MKIRIDDPDLLEDLDSDVAPGIVFMRQEALETIKNTKPGQYVVPMIELAGDDEPQGVCLEVFDSIEEATEDIEQRLFRAKEPYDVHGIIKRESKNWLRTLKAEHVSTIAFQ